MPEITFEQASELADMIIAEIQDEFKDKYISHNLINTIKVDYLQGQIVIDIPALKYDINEFTKTGKIIYKPDEYGNSYDELLETTGGFSKTHKDYLRKRVNKAIKMWQEKNQLTLKKQVTEVEQNER